MTSARLAPSADTLNRASSRASVSLGLEIADLQHVHELVQLLRHLVDRMHRAVERERDP